MGNLFLRLRMNPNIPIQQGHQFDVIILGAGVIGCSVAFHAAQLGAKVLVLDRAGIAEGTTSQSSGILRTHYSVKENVVMAHRSFDAIANFSNYVDDDEAASGFNRCGYLIVGREDKAEAIYASLAAQRALGIEANAITAREAQTLLPLLKTDDLSVFGFEPEAGYADAYLVASGFAKAARRLGAKVITGVAAERLLTDGNRIIGVKTAQGDFHAHTVVSALNVWSGELLPQGPGPLRLHAERHEVIALQAPEPYLPRYPVLKDMASQSMIYARCYGQTQLLASKGGAGQMVMPEERQADVPLDLVMDIGEQVAARMPTFAQAGLASSWTGLYDVTPDWNPVLGPLPGWEGLIVGFGFSGHGFKLSPMVGKLLAQASLGLETSLSLQPYRYERFDAGVYLSGRYGVGAVS
jgi:sarcosine oxidase, subunit beta